MVFWRGRWIAAWVIVCEDNGGGVGEDGRLEDLPRMNRACVEGADGGGMNSEKPILSIHQRGNEMFVVGAIKEVAEDPSRILWMLDTGSFGRWLPSRMRRTSLIW